jgi:hypothetical protein
MKQLPKAIRDLQGDLWVPSELADLLERVLRDSRAIDDGEHRRCLAALENLLGFSDGHSLPSAREQLGLADPQRERLAGNLTKG